jgi:class 3 adenylate cyclase
LPAFSTWIDHEGAALAHTERRLAAIMAADIAGYSALMEREESRTFARLHVLREQLINPRVVEFGGHIIKTTGDGFLAEFPSATAALGCGVAIQRQNFAQESNKDIAERFHLRIGVNLGDIISDGDDVSGDGVNIAARLEPLAPLDGLCVSGAVRDQLREDLGIVLEDLGEQQVKNITRPIRAYRISLANIPGAKSPEKSRWANRHAAIAAAVALAIAASLGAWAYFTWGPHESLQAFDAMSTPFASDAKRQMFQQVYPSAPNNKAIALAFDGVGMSTGASSEEAARQQALDDCRSVAIRPCFIYAMGMHVVWSRKSLPSLPLPVDINVLPTADSLAIDRLPMVNLASLRFPISSYTSSKSELKTMAIGNHGALSWTPDARTLQESVRHTLEVCSFWTNKQCLLIARGNQLTQPLPTLRTVKDIFLFSSDSQVPSDERARFEKIYQGDNWRAIAVGQRGTWEAVSGKSTEAEAISSVVDLCAKNGDICKVFAIGNFLVGE